MRNLIVLFKLYLINWINKMSRLNNKVEKNTAPKESQEKKIPESSRTLSKSKQSSAMLKARYRICLPLYEHQLISDDWHTFSWSYKANLWLSLFSVSALWLAPIPESQIQFQNINCFVEFMCVWLCILEKYIFRLYQVPT